LYLQSWGNKSKRRGRGVLDKMPLMWESPVKASGAQHHQFGDDKNAGEWAYMVRDTPKAMKSSHNSKKKKKTMRGKKLQNIIRHLTFQIWEKRYGGRKSDRETEGEPLGKMNRCKNYRKKPIPHIKVRDEEKCEEGQIGKKTWGNLTSLWGRLNKDSIREGELTFR